MRILISAIEKTVQLLDQSKDCDWSRRTVVEIKKLLEAEPQKIRSQQEFNKTELSILFAPTGDIQETAMLNGWHKRYLVIAKIVDLYV